LWGHTRDTQQIVGEFLLLGLQLRARLQMLERASAAHAEVGATRRDAPRGRFQHVHQRRLVMTSMQAGASETHAFAGQRARDEYGLAAILATSHHAFGLVREIDDHPGFYRGIGRALRAAHAVSAPSAGQASRNSAK
jgi:hypothetical protein